MGTREIAPCAALFNAEFTGQAISEDLRHLRHASPAGTGLESALRVSPDGPTVPPLSPSREIARFLIVESDPYERSLAARQKMRSLCRIAPMDHVVVPCPRKRGVLNFPGGVSPGSNRTVSWEVQWR